MRVYIAGPMRGLPFCNFPAFDEAAIRWRKAGHHSITPAGMDRVLGYLPTEDGQFTYAGLDDPNVGADSPARLVHVAFCLLSAVSGAEAIALLPGWERSTGTTMELAIALFLGLKVYDAMTMEEIDVPNRPWGHLRAHETYISGDEENPWRHLTELAKEIEARRPLNPSTSGIIPESEDFRTYE